MNIFAYAAREEKIFENMLAENGSNYERKHTFFSDLAIAECYGLSAIKDTHKRVMKSWLNDVKAITEYVLSLNYKAWRFNEVDGKEYLVKLYSNLYYETYDEVLNHYEGKDDELSYIFNTLD